MITAVGVHKVTVTVTVSHFYSPHLNSDAQFLFQFLILNSTQGDRLNFNYKSIDGRTPHGGNVNDSAADRTDSETRLLYSYAADWSVESVERV